MTPTLKQAETLVANAGAVAIAGTPDEVRRAALAECEAEARRQGWVGAWEATELDLEYVEAQVLLAESR